MKNHTDVLVVSQSEQVQAPICVGASQIAMMADTNMIFALPRRLNAPEWRTL